MGEKSRSKFERRKPGVYRIPDIDKVSREYRWPPVFRFFKCQAHADALAAGTLWISTLEICRKYEERGRGDREEGRITYTIDRVRGGGSPANRQLFEHAIKQAGVSVVGSGENAVIKDIDFTSEFRDAFVLCCTKSFAPDMLGPVFCNYCVKILDPSTVFKEASLKLNEKTRLEGGALGFVTYADRRYEKLQDAPGLPGFVKPPDVYAEQREFRMLWSTTANDRCDAQALDLSHIAKQFERIA